MNAIQCGMPVSGISSLPRTSKANIVQPGQNTDTIHFGSNTPDENEIFFSTLGGTHINDAAWAALILSQKTAQKVTLCHAGGLVSIKSSDQDGETIVQRWRANRRNTSQEKAMEMAKTDIIFKPIADTLPRSDKELVRAAVEAVVLSAQTHQKVSLKYKGVTVPVPHDSSPEDVLKNYCELAEIPIPKLSHARAGLFSGVGQRLRAWLSSN